MAGAAGARRAARATRRRALDPAGAAADAETGDELLDVGRSAIGADNVLFFSRGHEALEPLAALLARVFVEGHFFAILPDSSTLVHIEWQIRIKGGRE